MNRIRETLDTPLAGRYDVVVAGGGVAGIAAALSAADCGARVLLLERGYMLGGLATAGLVTIYLPLCDGRGSQVSYGMAEALLRLAASDDCGEDPPLAWLENGNTEARRKRRYDVRFNAQSYALLLEEKVLQAGVEVLFGAQAAAVHTDGHRVRAVIAETKGGRMAFAGDAFVDATGDADLFRLAGAQTRVHEKGNPLAAWYCAVSEGRYELRMLGVADIPDELQAQLGATERLIPRLFAGLSAGDLSEMTRLAHAHILAELRVSGGARIPATLPTLPQVRMTRCIVGRHVLDTSEEMSVFSDTVGRVADWRRAGHVHSVPFGALFGDRFDNLLAVGRCISVTDAMWDITRAIPACVLTGEAAGAAAAIFPDLSRADVGRLQRLLARRCDRPDIEEGLTC